jgi:hypothetical protein
MPVLMQQLSLTCLVIHLKVIVGSSHSTSTAAKQEDRSSDHIDEDPGVLVDRPTREREAGTAAEMTAAAGTLAGLGNTWGGEGLVEAQTVMNLFCTASQVPMCCKCMLGVSCQPVKNNCSAGCCTACRFWGTCRRVVSCRDSHQCSSA